MGSRHSVSSSASFGTCSDVTSMKQVVSVYNEITADKYEARLLRAVRRKDYRVCQYLARKRDVDLNVVEFGHSALNIAIHQRDTEIVKLLLDAGCCVDVASPEQRLPPLFHSVMFGYKEYVNMLIDKGCRLDLRHDERTVMHIIGTHYSDVVMDYMTEILDLLVAKGVNIHDSDSAKDTVFHYCARNSHNRCLEYFIKNIGRDINLQNNIGYTPLHVVIEAKNYDGANILLDAKANVNVKDTQGCSPLLTLAKTAVIGLKCMCLNYTGADHNDSCPLSVVLQQACLLCDKLVASGADVNASNASVRGLTPLHYAAQQGLVHLVDRLLLQRARHDLGTLEGKSPLYLAAAGGHVYTVRCLLEHGAAVDQPDKAGKIPLHATVYNNHVDVVQELLNWHANVNHVNAQGKTCLLFAAQSSNLDLARCLIAGGANMGICDHEGRTALHEAVSFPHFNTPMVMLLLNEGCDPANLDVFLHDMFVKNIFDPNDCYELYVWYKENYGRCKSLQHLCRVVIQQTLLECSPHLPRRTAVKLLCLPTSLQYYVATKLL